jgi:hypothetical protein
VCINRLGGIFFGYCNGSAATGAKLSVLGKLISANSAKHNVISLINNYFKKIIR